MLLTDSILPGDCRRRGRGTAEVLLGAQSLSPQQQGPSACTDLMMSMTVLQRWEVT